MQIDLFLLANQGKLDPENVYVVEFGSNGEALMHIQNMSAEQSEELWLALLTKRLPADMFEIVRGGNATVEDVVERIEAGVEQLYHEGARK